MNPGILRHSVRIQQRAVLSPSVNNIGEAEYTWTDFHVTRARIAMMKGAERVQSEAEEAAADVEVTIRYFPGVAESMRVLFGSVVYDIRNVINVEERNREMRLQCTRGHSNG
jgi:SPP1 family predicted phage head-tail adaptor